MSEYLKAVFETAPPEHLYHYTDQAGLLGIVHQREIWATHTQYLNDSREYHHAIQLVQELIRVAKEKNADPEQRALLDDMACDVEGNFSMNVCVSSFSEERDSLPQWRAYGGPSLGFAVGVPGKLLASVAKEQSFYLAKCIYDPAHQRKLMAEMIEGVLQENIAGIPWRDMPGQPRIPRGGNMAARLHRFAPILKDQAFEGEREWRIITKPLSCRFERFAFRSGPSTLIPYYRVPLCSEAIPFEIAEVVVGPSPRQEAALSATRSFLVSKELRETPVEISKVPFRNW
jgi:hypothetical protein